MELRRGTAVGGKLVHYVREWFGPSTGYGCKPGEGIVRWLCNNGSAHGLPTDQPATCGKCLDKAKSQ